METRQITTETRGLAMWMVLDRPERRNALSPAMLVQLEEALDRASQSHQIRAVVLTGRGSAFCAGADLETSGGLAEAHPEGRHPFAGFLQRLRKSPKPIIAAINGPAFGGGLGLVAAADIAIASNEATFSFSEVRLGLVPAIISVVVLPKLGPHHAGRLFLTGRRFSAEEARQYGLVHHLVPAEQLEAAVDGEVAEIAKGGPEAVADAKRLIREIPTLGEDVAFDRTSAWLTERSRTAEAREGVAAFREKRPPSWRRG